MPVRNYRDLLAWQKAMDFVVAVYHATGTFPHDERFGLVVQLRRAAVAIPSKIAEGQGRRTESDFLRLLSLAHGSLREAETHILIAERLGYLATEQTDALMDRAAEVGRLVTGLSNHLSS